MILGEKISFLIGGGCDPWTEYVELLVDGYGVQRATGQCSEGMEKVVWDVSLYKSRMGQIRIVDAASNSWGHINVDHFHFFWDTRGGRYSSSGQKVSRTYGWYALLPQANTLNCEPVVQVIYSGKQVTPMAGIAYAFLRTEPDINRPCSRDRSLCVWKEQTRLLASDRRPNDMFGYSLALDDDKGVAAIGMSFLRCE